MRRYGIAALLVGALLLTSCRGASGPIDAAPPSDAPTAIADASPSAPSETATPGITPSGAGVQRVAAAAALESLANDSTAQYARRMDNPADAALIERINAFAADSASRVLAPSDENGCYSPMSLYYALALVATGARGDTQAEMLEAMRVPLPDRQAQADAVRGFLDKLGALYRHDYADGDIGKLRIANSVWTHSGYAFHDDYLHDASESLYASLYNADFADPKTAQAMGDWVKEQTGGLIAPTIDLYPENVMAIMNTIHYEDQWVHEFPESATAPGDFVRADGRTVRADYMNRTQKDMAYARGDGYTSVHMGLKNGQSMVFVLPDEGRDAREVLVPALGDATASSERFNAYAQVILRIPKFSYDSSYMLNGALRAMGMGRAFEEHAADFTGMTDLPLWIGRVSQDTHIAIDEKGVEAAAFTIIQMTGGGAPQDLDVLEFHLTRPFGYYITTYEGTVLFVGVVYDPTQG